ncbi:hypothetical protein K1719_039118 [Acacia pycnantha]|nr:hypothetical protein K1719_039118 [Acacia pycnantha]
MQKASSMLPVVKLFKDGPLLVQKWSSCGKSNRVLNQQQTPWPTAGHQQGRQRGRNYPYEYINNLPHANFNDGSMLVFVGIPPQLWEEAIGRWESSTILHCSNIAFANNQEKVNYIENLLGETAKYYYLNWTIAFPTEYNRLIASADNTQNVIGQIRQLIMGYDPFRGTTKMQDKALQDIERLIIENMRDINNYSDTFLNLASKSGQAFTQNISDKYFSKLPPPFNNIIKDECKIGFRFQELPEPVRSTTYYPTLVRELINKNRDLAETQVEQLQQQLQQIKGKNKDLGGDQSIQQILGQVSQRNLVIRESIPCTFEPIVEDCEDCNAILHYQGAPPEKFQMNEGKTPIKAEHKEESSEPTREMMTFRGSVLVKYPPRHNKSFKPLPHLPPPDESQQCLLYAFWNASTAKQKHTTLNALNYYFSKIREKPLSKNFSFYVLFHGDRPGIYINYPKLVKAIGNNPKPF